MFAGACVAREIGDWIVFKERSGVCNSANWRKETVLLAFPKGMIPHLWSAGLLMFLAMFSAVAIAFVTRRRRDWRLQP